MERKHLHLLETARALSFQSNLPYEFWGDAVLCSTYLINRLPLNVLVNVLGNMSSYEKLFGHSPDNSHLKTYGCLCYVSSLRQKCTKFDPRADPCIFIGYPYAQKRYKVFNMQSK